MTNLANTAIEKENEKIMKQMKNGNNTRDPLKPIKMKKTNIKLILDDYFYCLLSFLILCAKLEQHFGNT